MPSHSTARWTRLSSRTTRSITLAAAAVGAFGIPALASAATASAATAPAAAVSAPAAAVQAAPAAAPAQAVSLGAPAAGNANTLAVAPAAAQAPQHYQVHSGDTLYGIAQHYLGSGDRYHEIFDANQGKQQARGGSLTNPDLIQPGWDLQIPNGSASAAPSTPAPAPAPAPAKQSSTSAKPSGQSDGESSASATKSAAKSATKSTAKSSSSSSSSSSTAKTSSSTSSSSYANNLDGWIKQAQSILSANGVSVSYNAIYQTVMHESGGNPKATNGWDSNAAAGHPSIGLMQTIQPTFNSYALPGHTDIYNPVDNIIAGARYAAARYGSLNSVVAARCGGSCWYGY